MSNDSRQLCVHRLIEDQAKRSPEALAIAVPPVVTLSLTAVCMNRLRMLSPP